MNIKKILLLSIILVVALAICVSPGFAVTKTTGKLYFNTKHDGNSVIKKIGSEPQDKITLFYNVEILDTPPKIQTYVSLGQLNQGHCKYYMVNSKVTFIKKVGSKTYYSTKTFKPKWDVVSYNAKNGYKPYYVIVKYTDTNKTKKFYFDTKKNGASITKRVDFYNRVQLQFNIPDKNSKSKKIQTSIVTKQNDLSKEFNTAITKIKSAKVTFVKKVGSKTYYSTKTLKPKNGKISYNAKNGYKPYSAEITYQWIYKKLK